MGLERFKKDFVEKYSCLECIHEFMDDYESDEIPFGGKLLANEDKYYHDSYGNEDTNLERVFSFPDYGVIIKFVGNRSSYQGEEWEEFKEVKPVLKTITHYE